MSNSSEERAGEGPVIDLEAAPVTDGERAAKPRVDRRRQALAGVAAAAIAAAALLGGAWGYARLGLDIFGGPESDRLGAIETRIGALEEQLGAQAQQRQAVADKLDALSQAVDGLAGMQTRIVEMESRQAAFSSSLENLQKRPAGVAADDGSVAELRQQLEALRSQLAFLPHADPAIAGVGQAFREGRALGAELDRISDADLKAALSPYRDQAPPKREALEQELSAIAGNLSPPALQAPAQDGSWSGWLYGAVSRFVTVKPVGAGLADQLQAFARQGDLAGAAALIARSPDAGVQANDWRARAEAFLAAEDALRRMGSAS